MTNVPSFFDTAVIYKSEYVRASKCNKALKSPAEPEHYEIENMLIPMNHELE